MRPLKPYGLEGCRTLLKQVLYDVFVLCGVIGTRGIEQCASLDKQIEAPQQELLLQVWQIPLSPPIVQQTPLGVPAVIPFAGTGHINQDTVKFTA